MIQLTVFCQDCGRTLRRPVDPDCPPSHLRCICGARFPLQLEEPEARFDFAGGSDEGSGGSTYDTSGLKTSSMS